MHYALPCSACLAYISVSGSRFLHAKLGSPYHPSSSVPNSQIPIPNAPKEVTSEYPTVEHSRTSHFLSNSFALLRTFCRTPSHFFRGSHFLPDLALPLPPLKQTSYDISSLYWNTALLLCSRSFFCYRVGKEKKSVDCSQDCGP